MVRLNNSWDELLKDEFRKEYYLKIRQFLKKEYADPAFPVYPPMNDIFNALRITDYDAVKAVILGQDPYHRPAGDRAAALAGEHLQRVSRRSGLPGPAQRRPDALGGARRAAAQHGAFRARRTGGEP